MSTQYTPVDHPGTPVPAESSRTENDRVTEFARRWECRRQLARHLQNIDRITADVQRTMANLSAEDADRAAVRVVQELLEGLGREIQHRDRVRDLVEADPIVTDEIEDI